MISSLCWVRKGVAAELPEKYELTEQEFERIDKLTAGELKEAQEELKEVKEEQMKDAQTIDPELAEYKLDEYDDEAIEGEPLNFFGNLKALTYYTSNDEDPFITLNDEDDDETGDVRILPTDNILVAARTEDEISQLEIYVYEESNENVYVHHDIMLPSFPLCLEWLDFRLGRKLDLQGGGNYIAVGTFEPEIEIWDLDTLESMYPDAILGKHEEQEKKGKKKKRQKANSKYHTDAVMSLAWNKQHRNILASSSADKTVKLWDLRTLTCAHSFDHHKDKVQQVQWHPVESTILLTASYDKTVAAFDSRSPQNVASWTLSSDPECLRWNPFSPQQFFVSTEAGLVICFDVRNVGNTDPIFTLHAHDTAASCLDVNSFVEGCIVTGSPDKTVKIWDVKDQKPNMVTSRELGVGKVFSAQFCPDSPFQLAVAGSKGSVYIWDLATNAGVRHAFEGRGIPIGASQISVIDKTPVTLANDQEESESDEDSEVDEMEDDSEEDVLETTSSSNMSNKKAPKSAFHGPAGGSFSQKRRVMLGNVKHSSDKKNISLDRSELGVSVFSDVDSVSGDEKSIDMTSINVGSLLDSVANTLKAKHVNTSAIFGSPLGSPNFVMDDNKDVSLLFYLSISLEKKWIDPKIVKTQVEVSVKKSFALDINLSAVERKSAMSKTQFIRKLFSVINSFGGATTPSKFEEIIRSTFTSKASMEKAASLARKNNIIVNSDFKRQGICSDRAVVIKEIPMNMPKDMIVITVTEFGVIKLIRVQLIGLWQKTIVEFTESSQANMLASKWLFLIRKNSVYVTKAMRDCDIWASKNHFKMLLFTLPVGTTAYDLSNLLDNIGGKTCIINYLLDTGNRVYCAVVGFKSENNLDSAFLIKPVFARLDLVRYRKCGHLSHSALECDVSDMSPSDLLSLFNKKCAPGVDRLQLTKLYAKKNIPISRPAAFGSKSWAQVVFFASSSGGSPSGSDLGLLAEQVSGIVKKLSFVELVPMVLSTGTSLLVGSVPLVPVLDSDMALDSELALSTPHLLSANLGASFSSSSSKVLTTKMGGLKSKMSALEAFVDSKIATCNVRGINVPAKQVDVFHWHVKSGLMLSFDKFDGVRIFTSGLDVGFLGASVVIIMNNSLACHVSKIEEISGWVIAVRLLFKNKLLVSVIGLYAGASSGVCFGQAFEVNSLIAKAINSSTFVVLGGNFNKNRSERSTSFKFCSGLGLSNSRGVEKTIDFIFVSENLVSAVAGHRVGSVLDFFDTDHNAVMVFIGLNGLLDVHLNSLCKQANKDYWKFNIKNADDAEWSCFRNCSSAIILGVIDKFHVAAAELNLDIIWLLLEKMLVNSVDETFSQCWFNEFRCSKNKHSSKFLGLELLIVKIVKKFGSANTSDFDCLVQK
ncbi:hypothetical protein G9A89_017939 [Geosiphon pyriformis]|nr:hypothetical protein G9A89_017939 [Geosiphon pyriformis]